MNISSIAQNIEEGSGPGRRWGHVFIYNPNQNQILLFGGTNKRGGNFLNDTWIWNNNTWKKISGSGPPSRGFCAATYHERRKSIIVHGGRGNDGKTYSDLWEWNGKRWQQIEDSSAYKADHHQIIFLSDQNYLLAYGGWNGEEVMGDTWRWKNNWEKIDVPSPSKRASFSLVKNNKTNDVILYGGLWINGQYADIWKWEKDSWKSIGGPYDNSSLDHHAMIYDSKIQLLIGFGGKNYGYEFQNRTFTINKNQISYIIAAASPSARHSFGFTYSHKEGNGYLYGGKAYVNGQLIALGDFWKWDGENWIEIK